MTTTNATAPLASGATEFAARMLHTISAAWRSGDRQYAETVTADRLALLCAVELRDDEAIRFWLREVGAEVPAADPNVADLCGASRRDAEDQLTTDELRELAAMLPEQAADWSGDRCNRHYPSDVLLHVERVADAIDELAGLMDSTAEDFRGFADEARHDGDPTAAISYLTDNWKATVATMDELLAELRPA